MAYVVRVVFDGLAFVCVFIMCMQNTNTNKQNLWTI